MHDSLEKTPNHDHKNRQPHLHAQPAYSHSGTSLLHSRSQCRRLEVKHCHSISCRSSFFPPCCLSSTPLAVTEIDDSSSFPPYHSVILPVYTRSERATLEAGLEIIFITLSPAQRTRCLREQRCSEVTDRSEDIGTEESL